jgi:hypothetical protein
VRLYLEERAAVANKVLGRPQIPGTDLMPEPSAPPVEEMEEVGSSSSTVLAVECIVCMDDNVSIGHKGSLCSLIHAVMLVKNIHV